VTCGKQRSRDRIDSETRHWSLVTHHFPYYYQNLKALSAAICIASAILAAGCADPLEKPITQEAGEKFQRGITGHGSLVPDPSNDPSKPPEQDPQHP
jgi:hypothetical protein